MTKLRVLSHIPRGQRLVNVKTLDGKEIQLRVHRNIGCKKLLERVVSHQNIKDPSKLLGLAVLQGIDGEDTDNTGKQDRP